MKKLLCILLAVVSLSEFASAQQNPQYSLFMFNKQTINPAYVGSRGTLSMNADFRTQWVKVDGNPETFNIGVHSALGKGAMVPRLAAGLLYSNESIGFQTRQSIAAQLAYRVPVSNQAILSFGVEGSYFTTSFDASQIRAEDQNDIVVNSLGENNSKPDVSAGVYLYHPRYFVGASSMMLLSKERAEDDVNDVTFRRHYFLMAGYIMPVNDWLKLRANVINKYVFLDEFSDSPNNADFNISAIFSDRFLLGLSYRTDHTLVALTQFQITESLNVAYGFDFKTSQYAKTAGVSHEIYIGIDIAGKAKSLTSPRFVTYF